MLYLSLGATFAYVSNKVPFLNHWMSLWIWKYFIITLWLIIYQNINYNECSNKQLIEM